MKNLLTLILLTPLFSQGQVSMDFGGGAARISQVSEKGPTTAIMPVIKISIGYEINNMVAEIIEQPTLPSAVNSINYFGAKVGYDFHNIVASCGYFYNLCNSDNPENNGASFGYSLRYYVKLDGDDCMSAGLYAEVLRINKTMEATVGFQIVF